MDECEYLCNRLAIMTNGTLKCIGPVMQLKENLNLGVILAIEMKSSSNKIDRAQVIEAVTNTFGTTVRLRDSYDVNAVNYLLLSVNFTFYFLYMDRNN